MRANTEVLLCRGVQVLAKFREAMKLEDWSEATWRNLFLALGAEFRGLCLACYDCFLLLCCACFVASLMLSIIIVAAIVARIMTGHVSMTIITTCHCDPIFLLHVMSHALACVAFDIWNPLDSCQSDRINTAQGQLQADRRPLPLSAPHDENTPVLKLL